MSWSDELQPASFRGLPFAVLGGESRHGRRVAVHEYPGRDKPYIEDLGRGTRRINVVGFLVENSLVYGGGSAIAQRLAMVAAAETAGPGTLVHPTLGELTVSVPEGGLGVTERWDQGRYFELTFGFIESGDRVFPSVVQANGSLLGGLSDALDLSAATNFISSLTATVNLGLGMVKGVISLGNAVVGQVVGVVAGFAVLVGQASRDATSLVNLASLLTGNFGRYVNANVSSAFAQVSSSSSTDGYTIETLTAQGAEDRQAVDDSVAVLESQAAALDASSLSTFPTAAQSVTGALLEAIANPGDAIRLFCSLSTFPAPTAPGSGQTQAGGQLANEAVAALVRRAAIAAAARAAADYVPSSYDDAVTTCNSITSVIDAEVLVAGDNGDDATYAALRSLRQGVVSAFASSGSTLASLQTFSFKASLPALTLANRLYQDASRSDQLISQADPIHPAFMPMTFQALAS